MKKLLLLVCTILPALLPAQQKADMLITNGQYFNGETFVPFAIMVVDSGRIKHISAEKLNYTAPTVVDAQGKYVIPGLIDCHVHLQGHPGVGKNYVIYSLNTHSALRAGVTTQCDLFSSKYKEMAQLPGNFARYFGNVFNAGPCITVPGGHGANMGSLAQITSVKEARQWAKDLATDPAIDYIKIIYQRHSNKNAMTLEQMQEIVRVAHKNNKKVLAHIDHSQDAVECALAGVDALAHIPMKKLTDSELDTLKQTGVKIIPTITVYQATYDGMGMDYAADSLLLACAHPNHLNGLYGKPIPAESKKEYWPFEVDYEYNLKQIIAKGIPLLAGTDAGNYAVFYGYSLHHEVAQYVRYGLSPVQALNTATTNVAAFFPEKKTGKLAIGYRADIVLLNANPLRDINNTKSIHQVICNGVVMEVFPYTE